MAKAKTQDKKFTESEMNELKQVQDKYIQIQSQFGQLAVSRIRLQTEMDNMGRMEDDLQNQFLENNQKEQNFVDSITKKYGNGTFNPDSGIFTPNK